MIHMSQFLTFPCSSVKK